MLTLLATETITMVLIGVALVFDVVILAIVVPNLNLYIQAHFSGARVGLFELIGMKLRKVDARKIVFCRIRAVRAGLDVSTPQVLAQELAGGNVASVVNAVIAAQRAEIGLDWNTACTIDLAGIDVQEAAARVVRAKAAGREVDFDAVVQEMASSGDPAFQRGADRP